MKTFEKFTFAEDLKKNMEEKNAKSILTEIDTLLGDLKIIHEKLKISNAKYLENPDQVPFALFDILGIPSTDLQRFNKDYIDFFKIRNILLKKFNKVIKNESINQEKINLIVYKWKIFEDNFRYGSYNPTNNISNQFVIDFIKYSNRFIEKINQLKNQFEIDLDTEDKFVLTPISRGFYVPCRNSFHEERMKNMREEHVEVDPFGEENW